MISYDEMRKREAELFDKITECNAKALENDILALKASLPNLRKHYEANSEWYTKRAIEFQAEYINLGFGA